MENREYWQGVSSKSLAQRCGKHASQTQIAPWNREQKRRRRSQEFVRVRCVEAIQQGKVAGQCVTCSLPFFLFPPVPLYRPPLPFLRSRSLKSRYGIWRNVVSSPSGISGTARPKSNLVYFSFKICNLVVTIDLLEFSNTFSTVRLHCACRS